ncbi:biogenesis of lysosome-related organelles complex 1 subunit 4 isoform X1 [Lissotriton helveticus]
MEREDSCPVEETEEEGESEDSGNVSQSLSNASGVGDAPEETPGVSRSSTWAPEPLVEAAAEELASYLLPGCGAQEMETMERSLEDLLTRVDEFVGMLDMVRSDSSQIVNESVPQLHTKAAEMKQIYKKIDVLEVVLCHFEEVQLAVGKHFTSLKTFVKSLGDTVAVMEEHVTKAETNLGAFPNPIKKFLRTISAPSFLTRSTAARHQQTPYKPPVVFRTEDYFPTCSDAPHT